VASSVLQWVQSVEDGADAAAGKPEEESGKKEEESGKKIDS